MLCGVLGTLFEHAVQEGLLLDNPARGLRKKLQLGARVRADRQETHALSVEQATRLLALIDDPAAPGSEQVRFFIRFALHTGCRIGETLGLQWHDVDEDRRELPIGRTLSGPTPWRKTLDERLGRPKSGRARRVHITRELADVLKARRLMAKALALQVGRPFDPASFVIAHDDGMPFNQNLVRSSFHRLARRAVLPTYVKPHTLRHTFAVRLLEGGAPMTFVQAQLGHASITMTCDIYGRWLPSATTGRTSIGWGRCRARRSPSWSAEPPQPRPPRGTCGP